MSAGRNEVGADQPNERDLHQDPADSTEVESRFVDLGDRMTRVEIEHRAWERLGRAAEARSRQQAGWDSLLPHYLSALARGES